MRNLPTTTNTSAVLDLQALQSLIAALEKLDIREFICPRMVIRGFSLASQPSYFRLEVFDVFKKSHFFLLAF